MFCVAGISFIEIKYTKKTVQYSVLEVKKQDSSNFPLLFGVRAKFEILLTRILRGYEQFVFRSIQDHPAILEQKSFLENSYIWLTF